MGRLVYTSIGSLDGFIADENGDFDWSAPDAEVHTYLNARDRAVVTELYGRRLYDVLKVWQTYGTHADAHPAEREYGQMWRDREKIVYSTTLPEVRTDRTVLHRAFDPAAVRRLVDDAPGDVGIGGPELAAAALRAGIVDAVEYYANPIVIGSGKPWLPRNLSIALRLDGVHRFGNGVVHLAYTVRRA